MKYWGRRVGVYTWQWVPLDEVLAVKLISREGWEVWYGEDLQYAPPPRYTCPHCGAASYNANDIEQGYCGRCHRYDSSFPPDANFH